MTDASHVCVLGTAAAFQLPHESIDALARMDVWRGATFCALPALDRASANEPAVLEVVAWADLVVLADGAVLHARSVWRGSALGEILGSRALLAIGSVGSVLGDTMIDPRGGAPTTGLGFFDDVVVSAPASAEQTQRTRDLLGERYVLVELGPRAIITYCADWRVRSGEDLVVTRNGAPTRL